MGCQNSDNIIPQGKRRLLCAQSFAERVIPFHYRELVLLFSRFRRCIHVIPHIGKPNFLRPFQLFANPGIRHSLYTMRQIYYLLTFFIRKSSGLTRFLYPNMIDFLQQGESLKAVCVFKCTLFFRQQGTRANTFHPTASIGAIPAGTLVKRALPQKNGKILCFQFRSCPRLALFTLYGKDQLCFVGNFISTDCGKIIFPLIAFAHHKKRVFMQHLTNSPIAIFLHAQTILRYRLQ